MRKLMILALVAMLTIAGSAFAAGSRFAVTPNATFTNGNFPTTTNNDDSCETSVMPAATLLLPIFDVNITAAIGASDNTLFTITNVSSSPQIAHVTVWTDWSFPVLDFNIFLTGYDVQSISMYDVIARGQVAPGGPGTSSTLTSISPQAPNSIANAGSAPDDNDTNPNIPDANVLSGGSCSGTNLPGTLPPELVAAVQTALTTGLYNIAGTTVGCGTTRIGGTHTNARGYVTIDVANNCSIALPTNPTYFSTEILFDNVLIGDYQQVNGDPTVGNFAQGNPMVHIKAVPEGGPAGSIPLPGTTNLPYTFYDRYTPAGNRKIDRRVPLPSTFAARWIEAGTSNFQTNYKIWREGVAVGSQTTACTGAALNSAMPIAQVVRFDERENSFGLTGNVICSPICGPDVPRLPEASIVSTSSAVIFPAHTASPDVSGWMYLNLNNQPPINANYTSPSGYVPSRASQNWVIVSMFAQGRYSVDFDAAMLGNGCSGAALVPSPEIGPAGGIFVCPPGVVCVAGPDDHPYSGTNTTP
jgi:hypothetical protein